jgi:hypothetical protein
MQDGAEAVLEQILHDAAHILNWKRGVRDTTARGAYHNAEFLAAAEEVGLVWADEAERGARGFDKPTLSDAARKRHLEDLEALGDAIPQILPRLERRTSKEARVPRLTYACQCEPARTFRISRTVGAQGPIICGVCGKPFTEK